MRITHIMRCALREMCNSAGLQHVVVYDVPLRSVTFYYGSPTIETVLAHACTAVMSLLIMLCLVSCC